MCVAFPENPPADRRNVQVDGGVQELEVSRKAHARRNSSAAEASSYDISGDRCVDDTRAVGGSRRSLDAEAAAVSFRGIAGKGGILNNELTAVDEHTAATGARGVVADLGT